MKISTAKTEVLHLSRNPDQCVLQVNGATLKQVEKFKCLGVAFTSDGRQDEELDTRIGKASAVMRALHYSVVMKRELSKKAKLSIFKAVLRTDYTEDLGWNRLGLRPSEMIEVMEDHEVWWLNLELLPPQPSRKSGQ